MNKQYFQNMSMGELACFIKIHTQEQYAFLRVGTNPVSKKEIAIARKVHKERNRIAFETAQRQQRFINGQAL